MLAEKESKSFVKVSKLIPETEKIYFINQYTIFFIISGSGSIQVDFKNYFDWQGKLIYLEKGQYIKFMSDDFIVRKIEFQDKTAFNSAEARVLFKHLISIGYIDPGQCPDCQKFLSDAIFNQTSRDIIDISSKQWFWYNPFKASKEEYHVIFDIKEVIDAEFRNQLTSSDIIELVDGDGLSAHRLVRDKVGISVKKMMLQKRLLESKREIAFTDKTIQEVAFDMGYRDPAYFNRIFYQYAGVSPANFRSTIDYEKRDLFVQDLLNLLEAHHKSERSLSFYANKMHLSVKTLSSKTRSKLNVSLGQLIRQKLIQSAQQLLQQGVTVKEVARDLSFEEPNHFSAFYKRYTACTPTEYLNQKVQ